MVVKKYAPRALRKTGIADGGEPAAWLSEVFVSFQGEGARIGERHLFVRFAGCNLRCRYCDTPASLTRVPHCEVTWPDGTVARLSNPLTARRLAEIVDRCCDLDPSIAMLALTGGEPMVQQAFLAHWLAGWGAPRPCLLETNAILVDGLDCVLPFVSVVSADLKLPSNSGERPLWDLHRRFLEACRGLDLYVKLPVDEETDEAEVRRAARLVADCAPGGRLFLQPITREHGADVRPVTPRLVELTARARGELPGAELRGQYHKIMGFR